MDMTEDIIFQKCITRWIYVIRIIYDPFVTVVGCYMGIWNCHQNLIMKNLVQIYCGSLQLKLILTVKMI